MFRERKKRLLSIFGHWRFEKKEERTKKEREKRKKEREKERKKERKPLLPRRVEL